MKNKLTKRQHYVPRFYLERWIGNSGSLCLHDLKETRSFLASPKDALLQKYWYEDDPKQPDNIFENHLAKMEARTSAHLLELIKHALNIRSTTKNYKKYKALSHQLPADVFPNVIDFVAYQYFRVPGANDQKRYEVSVSAGTEDEIEAELRPGRMTVTGYEYAIARFRRMKASIYVSTDREFLTSDWPCFDFKDAEKTPVLGEDIGKDPRVALYMPLSPNVALIMSSPDYHEHSRKIPPVMVFEAPDQIVRNYNAMIVQQAERFVVASSESLFVFQIAAKRKKLLG